jgi:preprotein translocase subunit SecG
MYIFLILVHVFVCLVLIAVILLQAGRGGGLSDMVGGQVQNLFGTQTNTFMTRATEVCAVVFVITSLSLGILSTQRGKSLVEKQRFARLPGMVLPVSAPSAASGSSAVPLPAASVPAETTTPSAKS